MNRLTVVLLTIFFLSAGCKKATNDPVWERSFGTGKAVFMKATADSGLISCGELGGKPYLVKLDRNKTKTSEFKSDKEGLFSSAWFDKEILIAAGSSKGKMLITCLDNQSNLLWDTTFSSDYYMDYSSVCYLGNSELLAIGSASPDSVNSGATGLYFVWFTTAGSIIDKKEIKETSFIAANRVKTDNSGNIYLALTRRVADLKPKATVAKYNSLLQKIWETDLYNNPSFGASGFGISYDNTGNTYISGKTELPVTSGNSYSSFIAKVTSTGTVAWRKYPENTNIGSSVIFDNNGQVLLLNRNCFVVNILSPEDLVVSGTIRTFDACDSKDTDAFGLDFDINYDGNLIMAGSKGGNFYLAMKPPVPQVTM
ncbi:MAG: hypothetical protein C0408_05460 [Odoribacter sp.]|nr:hypothetical protein [Odoribacter sp.]